MRKYGLYALNLLNILMIALPFGAVWYLYYAERIYAPFWRRGNWVMIGLFILLYAIFCELYRGFSVPLVQSGELIYSQFLACVLSNIIIYLVTCLLALRIQPPWPLLLALWVQVGSSAIWALAVHRLYFLWNRPLRTVILWDQFSEMESLVDTSHLDRRFQVTASLHISAYREKREACLENADAVFLCYVHSHERNQIIKYCVSRGVQAYVIPCIGDAIMAGAKPAYLFHLPMMMLERYNPSPGYLILKRAFDILLSGAALVLLSPLMLLVAALIRRDGGPALYRQERMTKDGKRFDVLKFRSMRVDAEKDGIARLSAGEQDPRITPVGRVIRRFRIDELPQLINIFRGEMSLVGPRPERPEIAAEYEKDLPEFSLRLQAKAGLTGYAQVYGKYNTTPYDKLLMDLQYIAHPSLLEDLKIILATIKILFMPESTEGVQEGQVTAASGRKDMD